MDPEAHGLDRGLKNEIHYENTPIQYTAISHGCKNVNFQKKNSNIFHYLL